MGLLIGASYGQRVVMGAATGAQLSGLRTNNENRNPLGISERSSVAAKTELVLMLCGFGAAFFTVTRLITERALGLARQQALPINVTDVYLFSINYGLTLFLFVHFPLMMIIGYRGLRGVMRARKIGEDLALCGLD
jgi:hypothetical protein